jgi:hypothetical protein
MRTAEWKVPRTRLEWHQAVDAADFLLHFESARAYGFVTGGPSIDAARCQRILADARAQGIVPGVRYCRVCGCTDDDACEEGCWWVEFDLCSACADAQKKADGGRRKAAKTRSTKGKSDG